MADFPWLAVAVGFPAANAAYLTVAITALKTAEHASESYETTYRQKLYADGALKIGVAAAFVALGPVAATATADPWHLLLPPLGAAIYLAQNETWKRYAGVDPDPVDRDLTVVLPLLAVPVAEEVIFRGGLGLLIEPYGAGTFLVGSAALFGLSHALSGRKEVAFKTFDGLVYGLLFLATGSVLATALTHVAHNLTYAHQRGLLG